MSSSQPAGWTSPRIVPRVMVGSVGVRVEDAVREALSGGARMIVILGNARSGRTTALECVRAALGEEEVSYIDDPADGTVILNESLFIPVVFAASARLAGERVRVLPLVEWGVDELVEWALGEPSAVRKDFVERAVRCLEKSAVRAPGVLAEVWGVMCADTSVEGFEAAVLAAVRGACGGDAEVNRRAGIVALIEMMDGPDRQSSELPDRARRLLRHRSVRVVVGAERLVEMLREGEAVMLEKRLPPELMQAAAARMVLDVRARQTLRGVLERVVGGMDVSTPATLVHLAGGKWMPPVLDDLSLSGAILPGVAWAGVKGRRIKLDRTDLREADLSGSMLRGARGVRTVLAGANLRGACWEACELERVNLRRARLRGAEFKNATLTDVDLSGADLEEAVCSFVKFYRCRCAGARLDRADCSEAHLVSCDLEEASMRGTILRKALVSGMDLRSAEIDDLCLEDAWVRESRLDGVAATGLNARGARFVGCDFTGSVLRCACFADAEFNGCGLAEVWWEGADLRRASIGGSTFHMGSSRSGLVGSTIAGEGSKTGFYTDDYGAQDFKPPEEISKADLRGCDLRGAKVEGVDFYLVDLRGAIYDQEQAEWFRKCGAILFARA